MLTLYYGFYPIIEDLDLIAITVTIPKILVIPVVAFNKVIKILSKYRIR